MITANYADRQTPQFRILSDVQCQALYLATLETLHRIGLQVHNAEARERFTAAGAIVEQRQVRLPPHLVQDALASAPPGFYLWARDASYSLQIAPDRVHFGPGPSCTYFIDPFSGERRKAQRGDAALVARLCDALPNIDYIMGLSLFDDVTPVLSPVYEFAESLAHTRKPVVAWANGRETVDDLLRLASAVAGSPEAVQRRPFFAVFSTFESPLRFGDNSCANLMRAAELGLPVVWLGGPTMGLESPFTSASALVLALAGGLGGLVLAQITRRGAPVAIGAVPSAMDLHTARPAYGSPEMSLNSAAAADLARYLKLPFMGTAGVSESKLVDAQAAAEISLQIMLSALSGPAMVHDVGFLDCADIGSLQMLVLSDEVIGMARRVMRGIPVNPDTIMLELIEQVGPGSHFMDQPQSVALCRKEVWLPSVMDRQPYFLWDEKGRKSAEDRIQQKLVKLLQTHVPPPLEPGVQEQMDAILAQAEAREHRTY